MDIFYVLGLTPGKPEEDCCVVVPEPDRDNEFELCVVCDERVYDSDEYAVGCDNEACLRWYHRHCLETHDRAT